MNDEMKIEEMIQERDLNAPRLSPEDIDSKIESASYTTLPSGKVMVCELTLTNGFTVRGESACVSPENFDEEIGQQISYNNARNKIWELEGYLLQQKLYEASGNDAWPFGSTNKKYIVIIDNEISNCDFEHFKYYASRIIRSTSDAIECTWAFEGQDAFIMIYGPEVEALDTVSLIINLAEDMFVEYYELN